MAANASGQPADVIAAKDGNSYLIDCKVCTNGKFPFSRVEENQDLAMSLWEDCGNGQGWFALLVDEFIYMIPHSIITEFRKKQASFNSSEILSIGLPIAIWATYNHPIESVGEE
jgi:Holliday junction resolvase